VSLSLRFFMEYGLSKYQAMRMRRIFRSPDDFTRRIADWFKWTGLPWERKSRQVNILNLNEGDE